MFRHHLIINLIAVFSLFFFCDITRANTTYSASADITSTKASFLKISPSVNVFPGETLKFKLEGSVNVNHHFYEVRRCKYFGLKCWYENRARPNDRNYAHFIVKVLFKDSSGNVVAQKEIDGNNPSTWRIEYPDNFDRLSPATIHAFISKYKTNPGSSQGTRIHRTPCSPGRPKYCSTGALRISFNEVDNKKRKETLETAITDISKDVKSLIPEHFKQRIALDPLLLHTRDNRKDVQKLFAENMKDWVKEGEKYHQSKVIEVIKGAITLHDNPYQVSLLQSALMKAYLEMGDLDAVQQTFRDSIVNAKQSCEDFQNCSIDTAPLAAEKFAISATAYLDNKARLNANDIQIGVNYFRAAYELQTHTLFKTDDRSVKYTGLAKSTAAYLGEMARSLLLVRTRIDIDNAKQSLENASCIWKYIERQGDKDIWTPKLKKEFKETCLARIINENPS